MDSRKIIGAALISAGLIVGTTVTIADASSPKPSVSPTPKPSPTTGVNSPEYQAALASYRVALAQYRTALVNNQVAYRDAVAQYNDDWEAAVNQYYLNLQAYISLYQQQLAQYNASKSAIRATEKATIDAAGVTFIAATSDNPTPTQLTAAVNAFNQAVSDAEAAYQAALTSVGLPPDKAELKYAQYPTKPPAPVKAPDPVRPTPPTIPSNNPSPTASPTNSN